ncbi:unnamed protein product [Parnassius apollo]|uniref:(apollo) hypothetical protein n=1 Tax=Parnassius apollo TaxID=110799 RepID=A0A8S3Y5N6_PARAO|nr:unnamed protein product [Parnassius apollo]
MLKTALGPRVSFYGFVVRSPAEPVLLILIIIKILRMFDNVQSPSMASKPVTVIHHGQETSGETTGGLSVLFTMLCIVDLFGVFPIVALPKCVIACASQSLQLFWWKITGGSIGITYCVWMILIGLLLCPVMWLGSPKDMKTLSLTSVCIVSTVAATTWACIVTDDESPTSLGGVLDYIPKTSDFLVAYGILAFQFDIHPMLLTLQVDMKDSRRINVAVLGAFIITGLMFMVTSLLAANRYGNSVENNILQGFCLQRCLLRSSIVALAVFLGESVPRFDLVMGLVGSTLTGPLMFIFPPLFFIKLCYLKSNNVKQFSKSYKPKANDVSFADILPTGLTEALAIDSGSEESDVEEYTEETIRQILESNDDDIEEEEFPPALTDGRIDEYWTTYT